MAFDDPIEPIRGRGPSRGERKVRDYPLKPFEPFLRYLRYKKILLERERRGRKDRNPPSPPPASGGTDLDLRA